MKFVCVVNFITKCAFSFRDINCSLKEGLDGEEYIEDIHFFLLNMTFISSSEATNEIYIFFTSRVK